MPEQIQKAPENYWREGLKRFSLMQDKRLQNTPKDTAWIDELTEERAQELLESLESIEIMIQNAFPLYGEGLADGEGDAE